MSMLALGLLFGAVTLLLMFSGMPIAFALGAVAVVFMAFFMPASSLDTITQNVYEEMASITLLSIPLFILKGAAIGRSRAGQRPLRGDARVDAARSRRPRHRQRVRLRAVRGDGRLEPGDLLGDRQRRHPRDAQARLLAGLRRRHHRRRRHARHPAAAVDHDDPVRGRRRAVARPAVPRRHRPRRCCWSRCSRVYAVLRYRREYARRERRASRATAPRSAYARRRSTSRCARRSRCCRACCRSSILLIGVMVALYGGYATPSETAGLGALLALVLIARRLRRLARRATSRRSSSATLKESTMLMFIIGMSLLFSYVMSYLHISQSAAQWIVALHLSKWLLLAAILLLVDRPRLLPAAGQHHPDDRADHPAAAQGRGLRPDLVRRADDDRDGDRADPPAGRPQHLRDQEHRARHPARRRSSGACCRSSALMFVAVVLICLLPAHRDRAARRGDGRGAGRALAAGHRMDVHARRTDLRKPSNGTSSDSRPRYGEARMKRFWRWCCGRVVGRGRRARRRRPRDRRSIGPEVRARRDRRRVPEEHGPIGQGLVRVVGQLLSPDRPGRSLRALPVRRRGVRLQARRPRAHARSRHAVCDRTHRPVHAEGLAGAARCALRRPPPGGRRRQAGEAGHREPGARPLWARRDGSAEERRPVGRDRAAARARRERLAGGAVRGLRLRPGRHLRAVARARAELPRRGQLRARSRKRCTARCASAWS